MDDDVSKQIMPNGKVFFMILKQLLFCQFKSKNMHIQN